MDVVDAGRVRMARITVINDDGVDACVGLIVEPNTEEGWMVLSREKALEVAARLMLYAGDTE